MEIKNPERKIFDNLALFYIDNILAIEEPRIFEDFPGYPNDRPKKLNHNLFKKEKSTTPKVRKSRKSLEVKKEEIIASKQEKLEVLSNEYVPRARKSRFLGHYTFELSSDSEGEDSFVNVKEKKVEITKENVKKEEEFFSALKMARSKGDLNDQRQYKTNMSAAKKSISSRNHLKSLSETSSDSSNEELVGNVSKTSTVKFNPLSNTSSYYDSDDERVENGLKKSIVKDRKQVNGKVIRKTPFINESTKKKLSKNTNGRIKKNQHVIKSIDKKPPPKNFDETMKKYSELKIELRKFAKPKIIPAPEQDPMLKKYKRIPKKINAIKQCNLSPKNSNEYLGGIFTVKNGWDKLSVESECKIEQTNAASRPNLQRHITPPTIVRDTNLMDDVMDAHNEFMYNENFMENILNGKPSTSTITYSSTSKTLSKTSIINAKNEKSKKPSIFSSDSESDVATLKPKKKVQKLAFSDDENVLPVDVNYTNVHHDDIITLHADIEDFYESEEENNNIGNRAIASVHEENIETEIDDLKMKICSKRIVKPLNAEAEFEYNTKVLMQHVVDPETDRILANFFGNVCPAFLGNRCSMPKCHKNHRILDESMVRPQYIDATSTVQRAVFKVSLRFFRLFQAYISIFVEACIKNRSEQGLIELVKACDRNPRTISCYKDIVKKLIEMHYMKEHRAISFIIEHHTDSEISRDTILSLILDSGPHVVFFMDYIEKVDSEHSIGIELFDKILHLCVASQNPKLPYFCSNYLQKCSIDKIKRLNSSYITSFLQFNKVLSELDENREAILMDITRKLLN